MDAKAWQKQGLAHYEAGAYIKAIDAFAEARTAYEEIGDSANAAEMLNNQGVAYRMLQKWSKAEESFAAAREQFKHLGDSGRAAQAVANMGMLCNARGKIKQAQAYLEEATSLFAAQGDRQRESDTRRALSLAFFRQRRFMDALAAYSAALDCAPRLSLGQRLLRRLFALPLRLLAGE